MKAVHNIQRLGWLLLLWFIVVGLGMLGWFVETYRSQSTVSAAEILPPTPVPTPALRIKEDLDAPSYSAKSVWVFERTSGSLLYSDNAETATSVASLSKLMTALVAYESYDLQDELLVGSASAVIGNKAKFFPRDRFTVADLIRAMLVFSANDAAQALANGQGEGGQTFVLKMNNRASEMGLANTHFVNSFGVDHPEQYSSAEDIGQLTNVVLSIPFLEDAVAQEKVLVHERRSGRTDVIYTTNSLLKKAPEYRGVKTGTTELAGESLVVRYIDDEHRLEQKVDLLIVLLGSSNRYLDAQNIVEWALNGIEQNQETTQAFSESETLRYH